MGNVQKRSAARLDGIHCDAAKMKAYATPIWRSPQTAIQKRSSRPGVFPPRPNASGAIRRHAIPIRIAPK